jgi:hypothetical protein
MQHAAHVCELGATAPSPLCAPPPHLEVLRLLLRTALVRDRLQREVVRVLLGVGGRLVPKEARQGGGVEGVVGGGRGAARRRRWCRGRRPLVVAAVRHCIVPFAAHYCLRRKGRAAALVSVFLAARTRCCSCRYSFGGFGRQVSAGALSGRAGI